MSDHLIQQIISIVKLIRSKGVGIYFITQTPGDIPNEILSQLGNRIQHVLRSYTKTDEKSVKAAANSFRTNPDFDITDAIKSLGVGEKLISLQDENGCTTITKKGVFYMKYEKIINIESAVEKLIQLEI